MKDKKGKNSVFMALTMVFQFGINMLVPIFLCTGVGIFIGKKIGADWLAVVLFFIGALAGARNVYIQAKSFYEKPDKKDEKTE